MQPTRRGFLQAGAAAACLPSLRSSLRWLPGGDNRCLLIIELVGGNDGLATVLPLDDDRLSAARPTLAQLRGGAHRLGDSGFGLHAAMSGLAQRFAAGQLAIVHGVGYPAPDRSHFRSRDIWHSADPTLRRPTGQTTGWLGRAADELARRGAAVPGLAVGDLAVPLALRGREVVSPAVRTLDDYVLRTSPQSAPRSAVEELNAPRGDLPANDPGDDLADFVAGVAREALSTEERLRTALARYRPAAEYPGDGFGRAVQLAARVVLAGFGTRILHLRLGGFDTHSGQAPVHAALLAQLDAALSALHEDLAASAGAVDRTTVFVHSEFGRRVAENRSHGTDHGAAGPALILGGGVVGGLFGEHPSLDDLDDGDLRMSCDFRQVYAELLRGVLDVDAEAVLGGHFAPLGLFG